MKRFLFTIIAIFVMAVFAQPVFSASKRKKNKQKSSEISYKQKIPEGNPVEFTEAWGWLMQNREDELKPGLPITDIGYFAAEVNSYGELAAIPKYSKIKDFPARIHLVVICESLSLTHFVLDPQFKIRDKLIKQIMEASNDYYGVQIDFELIPARDRLNYLEFLRLMKAECQKAGKVFTVCVPARIKQISDDIFPYTKISKIADRVIVMAYDEHWSTSKPGPIASIAWCSKVSDYAISSIPHEKLVMGLPFYGRSWASEKVAQGWYFSGVNRIIREYNSEKVTYIEDIPTVNINMKINTKVWFEDVYSTVVKLRLYKNAGIKSVAFWRIGQEDSQVWNWFKILEPQTKSVD